MSWEVSSSVNVWVYGGDATWEAAPNVYKTEDGRDVIHRYCEGVAKAWNAVKVSAHEYAPTDEVVVIICNLGNSMVVDIYKKGHLETFRKWGHWGVFRRWISSCSDLRYILPVVRKILSREGFSDVSDVVNYIVEHWSGLLRYWAQS